MSYSNLGDDLRTEAGSTTFVNGPLGITAKKTGNDIIYYTRDSNGTILNSHGAGGTVNYFSEFNGSVAALYSTTGAELGSYRYSPYGQTTAIGTAAESNPFRYIGGHQDKNNNGNDSHYKLGARYYDGHGHFTQPDSIAGTISNPKTLTAYNYAGGDPINSSDPSGQSLVDAAKFGQKVLGRASNVLQVGSIVYNTANGNYREAAAATAGLVTGTIVGAACSPLAVTGIGAVGCAGAAAGAGFVASSAVSGKIA